MVEWHIAFDAEQKKQFKEQDKKMTKKVDAQSRNFDSKMDAIATSLQDQLSINQQSLQQMMHNQREYLTSNLKLLLGSLQKTSAIADKNCKAIKVIQNKFDDNTSRPQSKHQKHKNMEVELAE
eukprot:15360447-Ditylum_brightwellii.AAC.1